MSSTSSWRASARPAALSPTAHRRGPRAAARRASAGDCWRSSGCSASWPSCGAVHAARRLDARRRTGAFVGLSADGFGRRQHGTFNYCGIARTPQRTAALVYDAANLVPASPRSSRRSVVDLPRDRGGQTALLGRLRRSGVGRRLRHGRKPQLLGGRRRVLVAPAAGLDRATERVGSFAAASCSQTHTAPRTSRSPPPTPRDPADKPSYNESKLIDYDHFLAGWYVHLERRFGKPPRHPLVVFVARSAASAEPSPGAPTPRLASAS